MQSKGQTRNIPDLWHCQGELTVKRKASTTTATHAEERERIEKDMDEFLAAGNKITVIPTGVSGQDPLKTQKHLRLGPPKDRPQNTTASKP